MRRALSNLTVAALALLGAGSLVQGGDSKEEEPLAQRAWFKKAPWTIDYEKAREEARTTGKLVFAYFTQPH
jgi:hypothetical protein